MGTFENAGPFLGESPANALYLVSAALIAYDILLTFSQEVHCIWRWKFSAITILLGGTFQTRIKLMQYGTLTMDVLETTTITIFSFLRAWAVTRFRLYYGIPFVVLLTGLVTPCVILYTNIDTAGDRDITYLLCYVVRAASVVTDILVVGVTWKTMKSTHRITRQIGNTAPSLVSTFLSHGNMYFCVIFALNIALLPPIVGPYLSIVDGAVHAGTGTLYLQYSLTSILISRFILDLRLVDSQPSFNDISTSSFVNFANRVASSLGAPLGEGTRSTWNDPNVDEEGFERDAAGLPVVSIPERIEQ